MTPTYLSGAPLHPAFVAAIRAAWERVSRRSSSYHVGWQILAGAIYWSTEDRRPYYAAANQLKRLQRLAGHIGYRGAIVKKARV